MKKAGKNINLNPQIALEVIKKNINNFGFSQNRIYQFNLSLRHLIEESFEETKKANIQHLGEHGKVRYYNSYSCYYNTYYNLVTIKIGNQINNFPNVDNVFGEAIRDAQNQKTNS